MLQEGVNVVEKITGLSDVPRIPFAHTTGAWAVLAAAACTEASSITPSRHRWPLIRPDTPSAEPGTVGANVSRPRQNGSIQASGLPLSSSLPGKISSHYAIQPLGTTTKSTCIASSCGSATVMLALALSLSVVVSALQHMLTLTSCSLFDPFRWTCVST